MAAFAAILDHKLETAPVTPWSWRPSAAAPFLATPQPARPHPGRAYDGVVPRPSPSIRDSVPPAAPASERPRTTAAPEPPMRCQPPPPPRPLTPAQSAALAVIRHLGTNDLDAAFTTDDLKRAFRALARRYHPDHAAASDGATFRDLHAAYQILLTVK